MAAGAEPLQSPFLRPHSGLARAVGTWDVFIFNIGLVSIGIGLAYTQRYGSAYYTSGAIPLATVLATLLMLPVALAMWCWTVAMPRSGGIYVFLTRSFHPALGFALSFVECVSWLFYAAIAAKLLITVGVIPLVGLVWGFDHALVMMLQRPVAQLALGIVVIWASVALLIRGTGRYLRLQRVVFVVAVVGLAATTVALVTSTPEQAASRLGELVAGPSNDLASEVTQAAKAAGWMPPVPTLAGSLALLVWPFLPLIGSVFSISIGGEVQNSRRNQLIGIVGSLLVSGTIFVIIAALAERSIGIELQGATAFLWDAGSTNTRALAGLTIKAEPWFPVLAGLATSSTALRALIGLGFVAWVYFWIPGVLSYCGRAMLAWSLDRVVPSPIGALHTQYATAWVTFVIGGATCTIFLALILFTDFFATLIFIQAAAISWCIALAFGSLFPWRRPHLFAQTPVADWKVGRVPWMAIVNLIGAIALGYAVYLLWNDELAAGHSPKSVWAIGTTFALGLILFIAMSVVRKRQGLSIVRAYREIPVE